MRDTCFDKTLWVELQARDHAAVAYPLRHHSAPGRDSSDPASARLRYSLCRGLASLAAGRWRRLQCRRPPLPREGSAGCVWQPAHGLVCLGGWTDRGLSSQVTLLQLGEQGELSASPVAVRHMEMFQARYGHSLTACGDGDQLYVFGGMTAGGYSGELADLGSLDAVYEEDAEQFTYRAVRPRAGTPWPGARGYHSACASACGRQLVIFGGIQDGAACAQLAVLDTGSQTWTLPAPEGDAPCARFGHSATVFDGGMWVVGGSNGGDLLRSGEDLTDIWRLDLTALTWARMETANEPPFPATLGRCHSAVLVGHKLLLFGGSAQTSNNVTALCLRTLTFSAPAIGGVADMPGRRFTHLAGLLGTQMLVAFGWSFGGPRERRGCLGDFYSLDLAPPNPRGCAPQPAARAPSEMEDPDDDDFDDDEEEDDEDGDYAAELNAHLAAFGQAAFADGPDGSDDEAEAEEYIAAAAELAGRFGQEEDGDDEPEEDVQLERTLVHAIVLAVNAENGVAVRLLMRRLQQLREMRHAHAEEEDDDDDEM
jgi:hypothetical protein